MQSFALFGAKTTSHFLKFMMCPHGQGSWASVDKREGSIIHDFCGHLWWIAPYLNY